MQDPTPQSLKIVTELAKKSGDYSSLSPVDLKVIALVHDLQIKHCGQESINYNIKSAAELISMHKQKTEDTLPQGFYNPKNDDTDDDDDDEDQWIDSKKINALPNISTVPPIVACISSDYSVQNLLMHMKIGVISSKDGKIITKINTYILRCRYNKLVNNVYYFRSCFALTSIMTKQFCPKCGNKPLHRVPITVDENGETHLDLDLERLRITRGFRHSTAAPKGGKHDIIEKCFEDQRIPQNRMARIKKVFFNAFFISFLGRY